LTGERVERRLAAILAADVVGYSRLVSADEADALTRLGTLRRDIIEPNIAGHSGRLFKTMGDGFLAEFASAVQAISCALAIQTETEAAASAFDDAQKMQLRIGIHVGDVMVEGDDLMGDGINIASRLESIAAAGGISISRAVHDQVRDRIKITFDDKGEVALKNITRSVQVFAVGTKSAVPAKATPSALALPDKPSIAVLPFQNMSGDPEQEYFADGMVEDIITALSRFKSLFVIARNSSFTYKGRAVDIKQVGRELGVRYVLEGSVRKSGNRIRITGQLIDAATGAHLWADRFDGELHDVFALQDDIAEKVVTAIEPRMKVAEIELATRRRPDHLSAYDLYLRALPFFYSTTKEGLASAIRLLSRALEIDPHYNAALLLATWCHFYNITQGWSVDLSWESDQALRLCRLALALDENDPEALATVGRMTVYFTLDHETATDMLNKSVVLNPNLASSWHRRGWVYLSTGSEVEEAIVSFERSARLTHSILCSTLS
jgi:adenylate cyclase